MTTATQGVSMHDQPMAALRSRFFRKRLMAIALMAGVSAAHATPPPPPLAPRLREASMTVTVHLFEAKNGKVTKWSELCKVSGKIPVYADNGAPRSFNAREVPGCTMLRKGERLEVSVWGTKAISNSGVAYAAAGVSVTPPDAVPGCAADLCGPQPLADSRAEIRVSGAPKSMTFGLKPNPALVLHTKSTVWFDAEVEIVD